MNRFLTALAVMIFVSAHNVSAALVEDFDGGGNTPFVLTNSSGAAPAVLGGGPTGDFVRLTNLSANNNNSIAFDHNASVSGNAPGVVLQFDFRMTDNAANVNAGGCCGSAADGLGIGLFQTGTYGSTGGVNPPAVVGGVWERPSFPDAFAIGLDIFSNIDVVSLNFAGAQVAMANVQAFLDLNNNLFHRADVDITPTVGGALVDMIVIEDIHGAQMSHTIFSSQFIAGFDLNAFGNYRLIAGGRTGGAFVAGDLDNIVLAEVGEVPEPTTAALGLLGLAGLVARRRRTA